MNFLINKRSLYQSSVPMVSLMIQFKKKLYLTDYEDNIHCKLNVFIGHPNPCERSVQLLDGVRSGYQRK